MFIDIHCHLDFFSNEKVREIVENARKKNVGIIQYNSTDKNSMELALKYSKIYPEVKACLGIYPIDALKMSSNELEKVVNFIRKNKQYVTAIGEVGLDKKESNDIENQIENFKLFIELSKELDISIIVHSRKAEKEAIEILEKEKVKKVVMHCFNGNLKLIQKVIENGWFLSIPTNVTYVEHFQKVVELVPIEQMFCESDSPFLHPVKGMRDNTPLNIIESYKKIAEIKGMPLKIVEEKIEENYKNLF